MSADRGNLYVVFSDDKNLLKQKRVLCACRLVVLRNKLMYSFFDVFIAVAIVVATAPYFDQKGHSVTTYGQLNPKCINFLHSALLLVIMKMFLFC